MIWGKRSRDLPLCFPSVFECNGRWRSLRAIAASIGEER